jgi:hypothetical protein
MRRNDTGAAPFQSSFPLSGLLRALLQDPVWGAKRVLMNPWLGACTRSKVAMNLASPNANHVYTCLC